LLVLSLGPGSSRADELFLDFDTVSDIECGETWEMAGLTMTLVPTSDCQSIDTQFGWYISRACLEIDVRSLGGLRSVAVDFINYYEPGDVYVYLMDSVIPLVTAYCIDMHHLEQLIVDANDHVIERIRICGLAFLIHSVSIRYGPVGNEALAWGSVKSFYR
jgi:hypothetical protein